MKRLTLVVIMLLLTSGTVLARPEVLFDQGHGQVFTVEQEGDLQLGKFAGIFRADGWQVTTSAGELNREALAGVSALVIAGPFRPFTAAEIGSVETFVQHGGRLLIALHIAPPAVPLLYRLGVVTANGVVREGRPDLIIDNDPFNFRVVDLQPHPVTKGLQQFSLYGGWPLLPEGKNCRSIAGTSPLAWVDLNGDKVFSPGDARQELSVAVAGRLGRGEFIVFGDDAIFQNRFLTGENARLAQNLSHWLQDSHALKGTEI